MRETAQMMFCADCGAVIDYEGYINADEETICESCFYEYYTSATTAAA